MTAATHQNASTEFVEANGVRYAYRRIGSGGEAPLVMLQHFTGNLDNWDPALVDALAARREVIIVDYLQRLTGIRTPTLIIQGDNDLMIPTKNSHLMAGLIPNASIHIYPDAAHASLFQYPSDIAEDVNTFLG